MVFSLKEEVEAVKMETLLPVIVGGLIGLVDGFLCAVAPQRPLCVPKTISEIAVCELDTATQLAP
jgi:hypothetical protein